MLALKPKSKVINDYDDATRNLIDTGHSNEGNIAPLFANILRHCAERSDNLDFIEQFQLKHDNKKPLRADGALVDKHTKVLIAYRPPAYAQREEAIIAFAALIEMLAQHLLTERLFRKVFANPDFVKKNAIAQEIEKVISALISKSFSRDAFLKELDRFYLAIERTAETITDYTRKQKFMTTVYEQFFQGFAVKVADTHGIVYTPPSVVEFMVNSVEEILQREFKRSLSSSDVHILEPFVGTGRFIVEIIQRLDARQLMHKYQRELHCNWVLGQYCL
jgi:type I restriction-modification system DNA methylase subunit